MNHKKIPWVNDKFILMIKQKRMLNVQRERPNYNKLQNI